MNNVITSTLIASLLFTVSCTEEVKTEETTKETKTETVVEEKVTHEDIQDKLHLHGESKWKVSEHMVAHIAAVDSLVNNYLLTAEKTPNELAVEVDEQLKLVTQTCDMKGEAHTQLHLWLLPFWNIVDQLKDSTDPENQVALLDEMKISLEEYHTYFE